jgi:hypothetical protein
MTMSPASWRLLLRSSSAFTTTHPTLLPSTLICRWKHSNRQINRLFKQHPARARVETRMGVIVDRRRNPPPTATLVPILENPNVLSNGWTAPATERPEYPFSIPRTSNKPNGAIGFLPVYATFR